MCQAVKDLIEDATKEANKQIKAEKAKNKAEKAKNKAAMLRIKELEKIVKNLQAQIYCNQLLQLVVIVLKPLIKEEQSARCVDTAKGGGVQTCAGIASESQW